MGGPPHPFTTCARDHHSIVRRCPGAALSARRAISLPGPLHLRLRDVLFVAEGRGATGS